MRFPRYVFMVLLILVTTTFLSGCSYSKEILIENSLSKEYGYYALEVVAKNKDQVFNSHIDFEKKLSAVSLNKLYEPVAWTWDREKWNYTKAFDIKEYPTYLLFDNDKLVLKTTNIKEVDAYLSQK